MQPENVVFEVEGIKILKCLRCGHTWPQRFPDREPKTCAGCNSIRWNKPRVRNVKRKTREV